MRVGWVPGCLLKSLLSPCIQWTFLSICYTQHFNSYLGSKQYSRASELNPLGSMFQYKAWWGTKSSSGHFLYLSRVGYFCVGSWNILRCSSGWQEGRVTNRMGAWSRHVWGSASSLLVGALSMSLGLESVLREEVDRG